MTTMLGTDAAFTEVLAFTVGMPIKATHLEKPAAVSSRVIGAWVHDAGLRR